MKKNLLVTLADENYIEQAKQLFSSVYWNAGWKGDYMLLAHKIPEKKLKWFRDKRILVKQCKPIFKMKANRFGRWPITVLSKFYLFTPEFKKWKNIIYLDADIIVRASLDELTKINGFAAVRGHNKLSKLFLKLLHIKIERKNKNIYMELKKAYDLNEPSFNSGVMAFNTSIIKKETFSKLKQILVKYIEIIQGDDNILNLFFYKKWKELPKVYNLNLDYLIKVGNINPINAEGIILHFHQNKPWDLKNPFYKEWKSNLEKADSINLKKIQPFKKWDKQEIRKYELYLKKKHSNFNNIIWKTSVFIDEYIGLLGLFLKKHSPKLYFKLKKLKNKFSKYYDEKKFTYNISG